MDLKKQARFRWPSGPITAEAMAQSIPHYIRKIDKALLKALPNARLIHNPSKRALYQDSDLMLPFLRAEDQRPPPYVVAKDGDNRLEVVFFVGRVYLEHNNTTLEHWRDAKKFFEEVERGTFLKNFGRGNKVTNMRELFVEHLKKTRGAIEVRGLKTEASWDGLYDTHYSFNIIPAQSAVFTVSVNPSTRRRPISVLIKTDAQFAKDAISDLEDAIRKLEKEHHAYMREWEAEQASLKTPDVAAPLVIDAMRDAARGLRVRYDEPQYNESAGIIQMALKYGDVGDDQEAISETMASLRHHFHRVLYRNRKILADTIKEISVSQGDSDWWEVAVVLNKTKTGATNLKNQLIRLGNANPDLRQDLKPVIAHLEKQARRQGDPMLAATSAWLNAAGEYLRKAMNASQRDVIVGQSQVTVRLKVGEGHEVSAVVYLDNYDATFEAEVYETIYEGAGRKARTHEVGMDNMGTAMRLLENLAKATLERAGR